MSTSRETSPGLQHLPSAEVINRVSEKLEEHLPEDYDIEEVNGYVHPPKEADSEPGEFDLLRREEDTTYFVTDPTGHEVAEIGFSTAETYGVEKITNYRFRAGKEDINSSEPDQAYARMEKFGDEILEDTIDEGVPDRPYDQEKVDKLAILNFEGEEKPLDRAETEQFQKAIEVLEESGRAHVDPEWSDRDIFYGQEEMDRGSVHVVTDNYDELLNFMRDTELYVEASEDPLK